MRVIRADARFIASFEGFSAKPYKDPVGVWTIGYGETHNVGPHTAPVTRRQAQQMLMRRLQRDFAPAIGALGLPLSRYRFRATLSAVYNLGPGILSKDSSFGKELRAQHWQKAANALLLYVHAAGQVLPGLVRRRKAERALFLHQPIRAKAHQLTHRLGAKP